MGLRALSPVFFDAQPPARTAETPPGFPVSLTGFKDNSENEKNIKSRVLFEHSLLIETAECCIIFLNYAMSVTGGGAAGIPDAPASALRFPKIRQRHRLPEQ